MERLTPPLIAAALLEAPAWATIGLGVRDRRMRERAAAEVAAFLHHRMADVEPADQRQMTLL